MELDNIDGDAVLTKEQLAIRHLPRTELKAAARTPIVFIMEAPSHAVNVGSMLRIADGLRAAHVYIISPEEKGYGGSDSGTAKSQPHTIVRSFDDVIPHLEGYEIIAIERTKKSIPYDMWPYAFPVAFVLGNEKRGVSKEALEHCVKAVEIPMLGAVRCLNVAIAGCVVGYHLLRLRQSGEFYGL